MKEEGWRQLKAAFGCPELLSSTQDVSKQRGDGEKVKN